MKKRKMNFTKIGIFLFGISLLLWNCEKEEDFNPLNLEKAKDINLKTVSFQDAKSFFEIKNQEIIKEKKRYVSRGGDASLELSPDWSSIKHEDLYQINQAQLTLADLQVNRKGDYDSKLFFINQDDKIESVIFTIFPKEVDSNGKIIKASLFYNKLDGEFLGGYKIEEGKLAKRLVVKKGINVQKAGFFMFFQSKEDCWNTENLPDGGVFEELDLGTIGSGSDSGGGGGTSYGLDVVSVDWYYLGSGDYTGMDYSGGGSTSVTGGAGTLYVSNTKENADGEENDPNRDSETGKCKDGYAMDPFSGKCEKIEEEQIDDSQLRPCMQAIVADIKTLTNDVKGIITKFAGTTPGYNWELKDGALTGGTGQTKVHYNRVTGVATTTFDSQSWRNASDLSWVRTILHESVHAYIVASFGADYTQAKLTFSDFFRQYQDSRNPNLNDLQHAEIVRNYVNDIASSLKEYGIKKGYNLSDQFYNDLSWGGLQSTNAFKALPFNQQTRILNASSVELTGRDINGNTQTKKGADAGC